MEELEEKGKEEKQEEEQDEKGKKKRNGFRCWQATGREPSTGKWETRT